MSLLGFSMYITCGALSKNCPHRLIFECLVDYQGAKLFERIRRIRRCGLVGGTVSLGVAFDNTKAHARHSFLHSCTTPPWMPVDQG